MSALRKLAYEPNGALATRAFFEFRNFVTTGLLTENQVTVKLTKASTLEGEEAIDAIERGFDAARRRS
jgi:hypothetical protein